MTSEQTTTEQRQHTPAATLEVQVTGMSCAACATRVEKLLNRLDGARASVNFATERAVVSGLGPEAEQQVTDVITKAGYGVAPRDSEAEEWHDRVVQREVTTLRRRLVVAALLAVPLMDLTIMLALVPGLRFPYWEALCVLLAVPIVTWCAWPFHRTTWRNLRQGTVTMETLVSLGIVVSFGWALATVVFDAGDMAGGGYWLGFGATPAGASSIYLDVAAGMTTFQLAGRYFETRSRRQASDVLGALNKLAAPYARLLLESGEELVPTDMVQLSDQLVVQPGETIPTDGIVRQGRAAIDTSMITGEPVPTESEVGEEVVGGTINTDGHLLIEVTAVGSHTQLAQMSALAEEAQQRKAGLQRLVDRVVGYFVPAIIVLAVLVTAAWALSGTSINHALSIGIAVLIIACPCALGLATPTALMVGVGRGAMMGILVKGQDALESSGKIDTIVLDKTGTLTTGEMRVADVTLTGDRDAALVLGDAAGLERRSEHAVARAILDHVGQPGPEHAEVSDFAALPGLGAEGTIAGRRVMMGSPKLLAERGMTLPGPAEDALTRCTELGGTAVALVIDGEVEALFTLVDEIKPSAGEAVAALSRLGLRTTLLTGDNDSAARRVATELGITDVAADVMPADKADVIASLQNEGHRVAMVGDGINDAAALAAADLGLAVVSGTDIALQSADIVLVRDDLLVVADAIRLSRRTLGTIKGNLAWAFGYNIAAIPVAAAGLLNPLIAAAAMALSSVLVVSNSLRLRSFR